MKSKLECPNISFRERLVNPHVDISFEVLLQSAEIIDLRDNHVVTEMESGYIRIDPKDVSKKY